MLYSLAGYLVLQVVISFVAARFIHSEADYLVAGRTLGPVLATFSIFATWFGAETVMGSSGAIAAHGLAGSRSDPFGYTICLLLMAFLLAGATRQKGYVTIGDLFSEKFGRRNEVLASIIMMLTSIIWAAAQIQAMAFIVSAVSPVGKDLALQISVFVVIGYTLLGGMLGDVLHDFLQGGVIMVGLVVLLAMVMQQAGGALPALHLIRPEQLSLLGPGETWLKQLDVWLVPVLGSLVAPEALSRTLATRDAKTAKAACLYASGIYLVVGSLPVLVALIGAHLIAPVQSQDLFLPTLVTQLLPPWMTVVFLGALVSAILSTIDSTLLSIAGLGSHNIVLPFLSQSLKNPVSERKKVYLARLLVVLSGLLSYWIATHGTSIYGLVQNASSFGSAGFLVCVLGGLYAPSLSPKLAGVAATTVLLAGVALTVVLKDVLAFEGAFIGSLLGCVLLYGGFCLLETVLSAQKSQDALPLRLPASE